LQLFLLRRIQNRFVLIDLSRSARDGERNKTTNGKESKWAKPE
jgi:hypothetical protein